MLAKRPIERRMLKWLLSGQRRVAKKAAFELVATAAVGAGLSRWQQALKALEQADASP
jgi:hypothetical protein